MWDFDEGVCPGEWQAVESPVDTPLYDVVSTRNGPAAVGGKGKVIGRRPDGNWGVLVENGARVYKTTASEGWKQVGIFDAEKSMYTAEIDDETILIGGGGFVYEREADDRWTPHNVGSFSVRALAREDGEMLAGGAGHLLYREGNSK